MAQYIMRLDDAAAHADWKKWDRMEHLLDSNNIQPLVGIIPQCMDPMINLFEEKLDFWEQVSQWKEKGWQIAMHGFDHVYKSRDAGFNPVKNESEFAGIPLKTQCKKIRDGVQILRNHGIEPQIFFAPSHTMDLNTIRALKQESRIRIISDTIAYAPYNKWGMTFVPQQSGKVRKLHFKIVTFCYHPNIMTDDDFLQLEAFLQKEKEHFIPFPVELCNRKRNVYDWLLEKSYFGIRAVREEWEAMEHYLKHFLGKIKEVGLKNTVIGFGRRIKLEKICKRYGLDTWHKSPYELRLYAQMAAGCANELGVNCVVEVGCGLGEILRHVKAERKYGYDIDSNVIEAAKSLTQDSKGKTLFYVGELKDVAVADADCLITISWMHYVPESYLKEAYKIALEQNDIQYVIVDVKDMENKKRNFSKILPPSYHCVSRKKYRAVESVIWIEVYKKMN